MSTIYNLFLMYLGFINLLGFSLMGIDKQKARRHQWRIPEKHLFLTAILGGSLGTFCGMHIFHHKTRHWYFVAGMPAILTLQAGIAFYLLYVR